MNCKQSYAYAFIVVCFGGLVGCGKQEADGIKAYDAQNYGEAREIFERNVEKPQSQYYLLKLYLYGSGVPKDKDHAYSLLRKSAAQGFPDAMMALAAAEVSGSDVPKDIEDAKALYLRALSLGTVEANTELGRLYAKTDRQSAEAYFIKGASSPWGKMALASFYEEPDERKDQKPALAFAQLSEASAVPRTDANKGSIAYASSELAEYLLYGYGVVADVAKARMVLEPVYAANDRAKSIYAWILFWFPQKTDDIQTAIRLWGDNIQEARKRQSKYLDPYTYFGMASAYALGKGVAVDTQARDELLAKYTSVIPPTDLLKSLLGAKKVLPPTCEEMHSYSSFDHKRYESLLANLYIELAQCNAAAGRFFYAYYAADAAKKLGVASATPLAGSIWLKMSPGEQQRWLRHVSFMNLMDALPKH